MQRKVSITCQLLVLVGGKGDGESDWELPRFIKIQPLLALSRGDRPIPSADGGVESARYFSQQRDNFQRGHQVRKVVLPARRKDPNLPHLFAQKPYSPVFVFENPEEVQPVSADGRGKIEDFNKVVSAELEVSIFVVAFCEQQLPHRFV